MVLDVGCGNGYYGWRMLHIGARLVLGLDPFLLFLMQFEAVRKYAGANCPHYVLPLTDADLPERLNLFDVTLSMGVLYHRTSRSIIFARCGNHWPPAVSWFWKRL